MGSLIEKMLEAIDEGKTEKIGRYRIEHRGIETIIYNSRGKFLKVYSSLNLFSSMPKTISFLSIIQALEKKGFRQATLEDCEEYAL